MQAADAAGNDHPVANMIRKAAKAKVRTYGGWHVDRKGKGSGRRNR